MKILERIELDRPILMHDKLDIIWDHHDSDTDPAHDNKIVN